MQLRYNFRLDPTPGQEAALARAFGCARVVWNDALAIRKEAHAAGKAFPKTGELARTLIAEAKRTPERVWLKGAPHGVLNQALRDQDLAYRSFFSSLSGKRKGPKVREPRFRSRKDSRQAVRYPRSDKFKVMPNGKLRLPKIGEVKVRWSRELPSVPSSVTVLKDPSGRYFASFVVATDEAADLERFPTGDDYAETGIDLGLTHFAILSDGRKIDAPKFLRKAEKKLKKLQQDLSRKEKGSANRRKAVLKVAKAHAHVADARKDFHHKQSTTLIRENQAVYVEDLCVSGLARSGMNGIAKSVRDAGWSSFVNMLEHKAARYGRHFGRIGRFEPSSQTCTECWAIDGPKPLSVREWTCGACGAVHDRDINAARYVLAAGRADRVNARGDQVRPAFVPAQVDEAGTHRSGRALAGAAQ